MHVTHSQQGVRCRGSLALLGCTAALIALFGVTVGAQAATKFGAKLRDSDGSVFRASANQSCGRSAHLGGDRCTRVAVRYSATGAAAGNVRAPRDGVIKRIRFVAARAGYFNFELARVKDTYQGDNFGQARVVARSRLLHYGDETHIQTLRVHEKVRKGDYLAIESSHFGAILCTPETVQQLAFEPVLQLGEPFRSNEGHSSDCTLLVQAVYADRQ